MIFSCCAGMAHYDEVQRYGYDAIILPAVELAEMTAECFQRTRETLREGAIPCNALNLFCAPELRLCGPDFSLNKVKEYCKRLGDRAAQLGVCAVGIGAPKSRSLPAGWNRAEAEKELKACLCAIADVFTELGISTLLEAVCAQECNFVVTTREAEQMVRSLEREDVGLVYDVYHAERMDEDPAEFLRAADLVGIVHTAQDIDGGRHYLREERSAPYKSYYRAICSSDFNGEVGVEAFVPNMEKYLLETLGIMKNNLLRPGVTGIHKKISVKSGCEMKEQSVS